MSVIDKALQALNKSERDTYISCLREIVGGPGVGGYGQFLGSLEPLVFATDDQKLAALAETSRLESR